MEKFLVFFVAACFATFIFIGIFHKIELSCPNNSTTRGLTAVNMTLDDVNAFCDAVRDSDLTNKKQYCLFNI